MEQFVIKVEYSKDDVLMGHVEICTNEINANDSLVWISNLFVEETYRHNGIGTTLMNRVIDTVKKLSIPKIYLYCKPELISFYEKFGAKDTHQEMNGSHLMEINNKENK